MRKGVYPYPSLGKPFLGPGSKFGIAHLRLASGLHEQIVDRCGDRDVAGVVIGGVIYRHTCADHGPISDEDATLNAVLLDHRGERAGPHQIVSLHVAGGVWVRLTTSLTTGETAVRAADAKEVAKARDAQRPVARKDGPGGGR